MKFEGECDVMASTLSRQVRGTRFDFWKGSQRTVSRSNNKSCSKTKVIISISSVYLI